MTSQQNSLKHKTVIVNGRPIKMFKDKLEYADIMHLAYTLVSEVNEGYTVTISIPGYPKFKLATGQDVKVDDGMMINIAAVSNA